MSLISVCCPAWNRQEALDGMFEMYDRLYPGLNFQFSVCDDGSVPPVEMRVPSRHGYMISTLPSKNFALNPCVPINAAVNQSLGPIIILTNPEVRHEGPVLLEALKLLEGPNDYVTARCYGVGYPGAEKLPLAGPDVDYSTRGRLPVPPGAHFHFLAVFGRDLWHRSGGFDEDFRHVQAGDDNDFVWRMWRAGARFRCTTGTTWQPKSDTIWNMPHGRALFEKKWPLERRTWRGAVPA